MAKNKVYSAIYFLPQRSEHCTATVVAESKNAAEIMIIEEMPLAHAVELTRVRKKKSGIFPKPKKHEKTIKDIHDKTVNLG